MDTKSNNNYDVQIDSDVLDDVRSQGFRQQDSDLRRLTLDEVEVRWSIGPVNHGFVGDNGGWGSDFDLLIDDARDFRSSSRCEEHLRRRCRCIAERGITQTTACRECDDDYDENRRLESTAQTSKNSENQRGRNSEDLDSLRVEPVFVADDREITLDDVLGPGATEAQGLRTELDESGLMKKDTRRPSTRCGEHDEHEQENT